MRDGRSLDDDLRTAWTGQLQVWWAYYNVEYVGGRLERPVILLADTSRTLGSWDAERRLIRISEAHIRNDPWLDVMETLRHEMAHQYADEVLGARGEGPHGGAFAAACDRLRAKPRATASRPAEVERHRGLVGRVQKLLSLGTSPNEHEAAAAMRKAHELLLAHNIRLAELAGPRAFERRSLGRIRVRHHAWEYTLSALLNDFFFVRIIWAHSYDPAADRSGTLVDAYGTAENLDMAEYVFTYLDRLLPSLWEGYKERAGLTRNRERLRYFDGVLLGFRQKLARQTTQLGEERGLVHKGDPELTRFYRHHNPRVRSAGTVTAFGSRAFDDGIRDGRRLSIQRPLTGQQGTRGLLPG